MVDQPSSKKVLDDEGDFTDYSSEEIDNAKGKKKHLCQKNQLCPKCFKYKFISGKAVVHHISMYPDDVLTVNARFELSRNVRKILKKKDVQIRLFEDEENAHKYFKLITRQRPVDSDFLRMEFKMIAKPPRDTPIR